MHQYTRLPEFITFGNNKVIMIAIDGEIIDFDCLVKLDAFQINESRKFTIRADKNVSLAQVFGFDPVTMLRRSNFLMI